MYDEDEDVLVESVSDCDEYEVDEFLSKRFKFDLGIKFSFFKIGELIIVFNSKVDFFVIEVIEDEVMGLVIFEKIVSVFNNIFVSGLNE